MLMLMLMHTHTHLNVRYRPVFTLVVTQHNWIEHIVLQCLSHTAPATSVTATSWEAPCCPALLLLLLLRYALLCCPAMLEKPPPVVVPDAARILSPISPKEGHQTLTIRD